MHIRPNVVHLVDDTTPGGVMRVLQHIVSCPRLARHATHSFRAVSRDRAYPQIKADIIVSHLSISWRNLPKLISLRARHAGTSLVHVEHSYTEGFTALNVPARARFYALLRMSYALFDRVVSVSETQGVWLRGRGLVKPAALRVIASCVALEAFRQLPAVQGSPTRFGAMGRLDRQKGFDLLIEAFRTVQNPDLRLEIFGDGPEKDALQSLAASDPRIRFHDFIAAPEAAMAQVDAVLMPSRWEAFGLVALEARAAGRAVALAQVDGLRDQTTHGVQPVYWPSVAEWAEAIELMSKQPVPADIPKGCAQAEEVFADGWTDLVAELCAIPNLQAA